MFTGSVEQDANKEGHRPSGEAATPSIINFLLQQDQRRNMLREKKERNFGFEVVDNYDSASRSPEESDLRPLSARIIKETRNNEPKPIPLIDNEFIIPIDKPSSVPLPSLMTSTSEGRLRISSSTITSPSGSSMSSSSLPSTSIFATSYTPTTELLYSGRPVSPTKISPRSATEIGSVSFKEPPVFGSYAPRGSSSMGNVGGVKLDIWEIVKAGNKNLLLDLLESGGDNLISSTNQFKQTPLHIAAEKGFLELVSILISFGADVNAKDKNGWTALHSACHSGQWAVCDVLLRQGDSSVMVISGSGATPLHYLMKWPLGDMTQEKTTFYAQCVSAFKKIFYLMLEKGAIVNAQNNYGETPLHQATGLPIAVIMLLENGANINLRTVSGETALHYACRSGNEKAVQVLLDYGADVTISGHQGTAADVAKATKHQGILALLNDNASTTKKEERTTQSLSSSSGAIQVDEASKRKSKSVLRRGESVDDRRLQRASQRPQEPRKQQKIRKSIRIQPHGFLFWDDELIKSLLLLQSTARRSCINAGLSLIPASSLENQRHLFNIKDDELFIEDFACTFNRKHKGVMLIFQHSICFYSTNASGVIETKEIIPFNDISSLIRIEDVLEIVTNRKFIFSHFAAFLQEVENLLEFLKNNREKIGPIVYRGYPIQQMLGAIKNPADYKEFQERLSQVESYRQGLVASSTCTLQILDETEGMLESPEIGKIFISEYEVTFTSSVRGSKRMRNFAFTQIQEVESEKNIPVKIHLSVAGLRYSFFTFPSIYYFDKILISIQKAWTAAKKKIHLQNILVFGASSLVGILVVKELSAEACVRAAMEEREITPTTSEAAERVSALGAQLYPVNFSSAISIRKALEGMNRIYWVSDQEDEEDVWRTSLLVNEMTEINPKIDFIVKVSSLRAKEDVVDDATYETIQKYVTERAIISSDQYEKNMAHPRPKPVIKDPVILPSLSYHRQAESIIERSGLPYVFLRCNLLMQHFISLPIKTQGVFHFPLGDAKVSWIDARDVASASTAILLCEDDERYKNCKFYLTGQESLSCETTAGIFSRILSKRVQYIDLDEDQVKQNMAGSTKPSNLSVLTTFRLAREGKAGDISNDVVKICSSRMAETRYSFEQFVNDHITFFKDTYRLYFSQKEQVALECQFQNIDMGRTGCINRTQFCTALGSVMNEIGLADALFSAFDYKRDEVLNLKEYFTGMSVMMKGTVEEKLEFAFRMHDLNHDGYLTYEEFLGIVNKIKSLGVKCREIEGLVVFITKYIFQRPEDTTSIESLSSYSSVTLATPKVTREEWKERALKNLKLLQNYGLLSTHLVKQQETKTKEKLVVFGHVAWDLVFNMLLSITRSVSQLHDRDLTSISLTETLDNKYFEEENTITLADTTDEDATAWVITDCAPVVFHLIRGLLGIKEDDYLGSVGIGRPVSSMLLGSLTMPYEGSSSGRSGSFFFKTEDKKYFVKTISSEEDLIFRKILPSYYDYLSRTPNSLLSRFLGLYKIKKGLSGKEMSFVVMTNVFDAAIEIDEQYDLKGSTVGRHVTLEDNNDSSDIALKDMNFKHKISLGPERKAQLMEQVERDCKFMEGHSICDYSLLIGIAYLQQPVPVSFEDNKERESSIFKRHHGGILSLDKSVIYFIGIIDNLTPYNYKKMGEYLFKRLLHDKNKISAIPPDRYRARFQQYVASIVE